MPLDEREQRILEEIEAQFYQEDPAFAQTVRDTSLKTFAGKRVRLAVVGFVAGLVIMLALFTSNRFVAFAGFILMVGSAVSIVTALRRRSGGREANGPVGGWLDGVRQRWRRSR